MVIRFIYLIQNINDSVTDSPLTNLSSPFDLLKTFLVSKKSKVIKSHMGLYIFIDL